MTPLNWKSRRAQYFGQGPKLQKVHFRPQMQFVRQKLEMKTWNDQIQVLLGYEMLELEISFFWKFFHPYNKDGGGMFLEVKIMEIFDPIWGFQPNFFSKFINF